MRELDDAATFMDVMPKGAMSRIYNINDYTKIKGIDDKSDVQEINIEIIDLLRNLGFSLEMEGTYLLADVVMAAYIFLYNAIENGTDYNLYYSYLQRLMKNPYSQFYFDLARNEHAMGTTTMHNRINSAYLERKKEHINKNIEHEIFGYNQEGDIYDHSLEMAKYLYDRNQIKGKKR